MKPIARRKFLSLSAKSTAVSLLTSALAKGHSHTADSQRKMNVLLIATDDLRPQLGCYGHAQMHTPNIDRLASRGIVFTRTYSQLALCAPSRVSLLTGYRPDMTKVYNLDTHFREKLPYVVTLPQHFRNNGYHTQALGKVYHNGQTDPQSWSTLAWHPSIERYAIEENIALHKRLKRVQAAGRTGAVKNGPPVESADVADNAYRDGLLVDKAIAVMREIQRKPFFLAVGFYAPHLPFCAPKKYWDFYPLEEITLPDNRFPPKGVPEIALHNWAELRQYYGIPQKGNLCNDQARELIQGYYASVSYLDAQVGKLLDELDRLKLRDNTIILLFGDQGFHLGENGLWCKNSNFEMSVNSPLIVAIPNQETAGQKTEALTELVDIYPSLCELCGLPLPKHLEGFSFAPLLTEPNRKWKNAAFSQYLRERKNVMGYSLRTNRYNFTRWQWLSQERVELELYDRSLDPQENVNIANLPQNAELVEELTHLLERGWRGALPPELGARG